MIMEVPDTYVHMNLGKILGYQFLCSLPSLIMSCMLLTVIFIAWVERNQIKNG